MAIIGWNKFGKTLINCEVLAGVFRTSVPLRERNNLVFIERLRGAALVIDPTRQGQKPHPSRVELLMADNFTDTTHAAAQVQTLDPIASILIPPFRIVRTIRTNP
jgi:hypothetical protein